MAFTPPPKAGHVRERHTEAAGAPEHTMLWAMVETPEAIFNVREIAAASPRLAVLVMGTNDLVKETYAEHVPGRAPLLTALSLSLLAARAAGIAILDGVYNDVKNLEGFLAECEQGRQLGFDGKTLIHPGQVEGANEAFAPSEQAVEDARGLIQAWEDAQSGLAGGSGVVTYKKVEALQDAVKFAPLERLMVETDSPYLSPAPFRGKWPNEPMRVAETAKKVAELHGRDADEVALTCAKNTAALLGLKLAL